MPRKSGKLYPINVVRKVFCSHGVAVRDSSGKAIPVI